MYLCNYIYIYIYIYKFCIWAGSHSITTLNVAPQCGIDVDS